MSTVVYRVQHPRLIAFQGRNIGGAGMRLHQAGLRIINRRERYNFTANNRESTGGGGGIGVKHLSGRYFVQELLS